MATRTPDHDLLIEINTKLSALTETVKDFGTRFAQKADLAAFIELKTTVESLQRFRWTILGGLVVLQLIAETLLHVFVR